MLSERSQTQKNTYCMIPSIPTRPNRQIFWLAGTGSLTAINWKWPKSFLGGDRHILALNYDDGCSDAQLCKFTKNH